jgi:uncharacterized protein (DUF2147 family)
MRASPVITLAAALLLALPGALAGNEPADAILGVWLTEEGDKGGRAHVEIRRQGETFVGRIVHLEEPNFPPGEERAGQPKVDLENPDPELRERPILGLRILEGFRFDDRGRWSGGTIYDPANGRTYRAEITLRSRDRLDLRGYVGIRMFGRTTTWKRVE